MAEKELPSWAKANNERIKAQGYANFNDTWILFKKEGKGKGTKLEKIAIEYEKDGKSFSNAPIEIKKEAMCLLVDIVKNLII